MIWLFFVLPFLVATEISETKAASLQETYQNAIKEFEQSKASLVRCREKENTQVKTDTSNDVIPFIRENEEVEVVEKSSFEFALFPIFKGPRPLQRSFLTKHLHPAAHLILKGGLERFIQLELILVNCYLSHLQADSCYSSILTFAYFIHFVNLFSLSQKEMNALRGLDTFKVILFFSLKCSSVFFFYALTCDMFHVFKGSRPMVLIFLEGAFRLGLEYYLDKFIPDAF